MFELLREAGARLEEPHEIQGFVYFPSEAAARRTAAQLEPAGFAVYVDPNPPGRWLLEAVKVMVPTAEQVMEFTAALRAAARGSGGQYDGWWATEQPDEEGEPALEAGAGTPIELVDSETAGPEAEADNDAAAGEDASAEVDSGGAAGEDASPEVDTGGEATGGADPATSR